MHTAVGIFHSQEAAERTAEQLCSLGIARENMNFLIPGAPEAEIEKVPTTDAEQPGIGPALGGVVGGAVGASGGLMSAVVLSTLIPGIGPVMAVGLTALGLVGALGGAMAGAVAGNALENAMSDGLPKDELFVYEDALRKGRTVLMAHTEDDDQAEAARLALAEAGAESLDTARDMWWIGLRDAEAEAYTAAGGDFTRDEVVYRRGFEAALRPAVSGKPYSEVVGYLRTQYPDVYDHPAFCRGFERGQDFYGKVTYVKLMQSH